MDHIITMKLIELYYIKKIPFFASFLLIIPFGLINYINLVKNEDI